MGIISILYQRFLVVIIHRYFFVLFGLWLCCWVYNIPILTYRTYTSKNISLFGKLVHFLKTLLHWYYYNQPPIYKEEPLHVIPHSGTKKTIYKN